MFRILIIKTGALGDVLRTTSVLPGLHARHQDCRITWVTAPAAADLVAHHPLVHEVLTVAPKDEQAVAELGRQLALGWFDLLLSLDDEEPLCRLASAVPHGRLTGAYLSDTGRTYTDDVEPWFGMGLLAKAGKATADRRKIENRRSHPAIFADMLGIDQGTTMLPLPEADRLAADRHFEHWELRDATNNVIGLNTGASGRWHSKALPEPRVVELLWELHRRVPGNNAFLLLGGPEETERNQRIMDLYSASAADVSGPRVIDAGTDHPLLHFAAIIANLDLLITSDSLALHLATANRVPVVAFFAPTSAQEIELGIGEKIISTAPDYCSYKPDADNATITATRIADAVVRVMAERPTR